MITVVFRPSPRCGEGIKGGGGKVRLDAKTVKVLRSKADEQLAAADIVAWRSAE